MISYCFSSFILYTNYFILKYIIIWNTFPMRYLFTSLKYDYCIRSCHSKAYSSYHIYSSNSHYTWYYLYALMFQHYDGLKHGTLIKKKIDIQHSFCFCPLWSQCIVLYAEGSPPVAGPGHDSLLRIVSGCLAKISHQTGQ